MREKDKAELNPVLVLKRDEIILVMTPYYEVQVQKLSK